ncbi:MAG: DNA-deoxyinosine glycosylase [Polaromonas sp.]|nr:DNA-deoxyinosine glycosylase [Polaromonas sp.]
MLTGLPPLVSPQTRLLILGSFPGVASLAAQQYYGHPQNQFWKILQAVWPSSPCPTGVNSYQNRSDWLLARKLGVWDVYASCEREGSLDSAIRQPVVNDFAGLQVLCPELEAIAHNGGESFKHAGRVGALLAEVPADVRRAGPPQASTAPLSRARGSAPPEAHEVKSVGVKFYKLPSTSPANASWSFERKLAAWRDVFEKHRLTD